MVLGGMRTYVAEGAKVIVPTPDKAYFEKDIKMPHTVVPDDLQKKPRSTEITRNARSIPARTTSNTPNAAAKAETRRPAA